MGIGYTLAPLFLTAMLVGQCPGESPWIRRAIYATSGIAYVAFCETLAHRLSRALALPLGPADHALMFTGLLGILLLALVWHSICSAR